MTTVLRDPLEEEVEEEEKQLTDLDHIWVKQTEKGEYLLNFSFLSKP